MINILEILKEILETLKNNKSEKFTFTVQEAAEFSGIGQEKIRELVSASNTDFPHFKVGKKVMINKEAFKKWMNKITEEHRNI